MLLDPILPERSLAMLYAPRGVGKTLLVFRLVWRWRVVLHCFAGAPDNDVCFTLMAKCRLFRYRNEFEQSQRVSVPRFRTTDSGFSRRTIPKTASQSDRKGAAGIDPLLKDVDLVILDNLSTLCTNGSESASDAWVPMQNWLLKLRRQGIAVLLVHHAGTNGRQRGTSRREDALDTVIALRRPEDYSPEQGARFEVHFEKLRNRVEGDAAVPFEAKLEFGSGSGRRRLADPDIESAVLKQAAELFQEGLTVGGCGCKLKMSKTEAGRLRLRALDRWTAGLWHRWRQALKRGEAPSDAVTSKRQASIAVAHPGLRGIRSATRTCNPICLSPVPLPMGVGTGTAEGYALGAIAVSLGVFSSRC